MNFPFHPRLDEEEGVQFSCGLHGREMNEPRTVRVCAVSRIKHHSRDKDYQAFSCFTGFAIKKIFSSPSSEEIIKRFYYDFQTIFLCVLHNRAELKWLCEVVRNYNFSSS